MEIIHGEKNLGLNARELMSFTRGLLVVRMLQVSLVMFTVTSCVQCTTSSLILTAPTHLRKFLKSVGFIATLRCAKSVKLTTRYFQEIPRTFSVRLLAIAFQAMYPLVRYRAAKLPRAQPKMKSQEISQKKSVGSLGNISRPTSRLQCRQRLLLAEVTLALFPYAPRLLSVVSYLAIKTM